MPVYLVFIEFHFMFFFVRPKFVCLIEYKRVRRVDKKRKNIKIPVNNFQICEIVMKSRNYLRKQRIHVVRRPLIKKLLFLVNEKQKKRIC